ncbi:MAG: type IV secretion system protein, partial [Acetobacteraceae bacterium]|nr:type IV secretion system protein [Acetobacteraceae bacterium]
MNGLFTPYAHYVQGQLTQGVQTIVANEIASVRVQLATIGSLWALVQGCLMVWAPLGMGRYPFWPGFRNLLFLVIGTALIATGSFEQFVRQPFMNTIPNWIAQTVSGTQGADAGNQQFDDIYTKSAHIESIVLKHTSPVWDIDTRIKAGAYMGLIGLGLSVAYSIWSGCAMFAAVSICAGPVLLAGIGFEYTRRYTLRWADVLVGLMLGMLLIMILMSLFVSGITSYLTDQAQNPAVGVDMQVDSLLKIGVFVWLCSFTAVGTVVVAAVIAGGVTAPISRLAH